LDELDLQPGDILELSAGPDGGQNYGGGWWEGEKQWVDKGETGLTNHPQGSTSEERRVSFPAIMLVHPVFKGFNCRLLTSLLLGRICMSSTSLVVV